MILNLTNCIAYTVSFLIPKKKNRWVFGSWMGKSVSDNSKALFDYLQETHPEIEKVWIVRDPEKYNMDGCKIVKRNSPKGMWYALTAKVAIMNQGFVDFCTFNLLGGCYKVQLWHGIAWKKIIRDAMPELTGIRGKVFSYLSRYDLYIAPSELYKKTVKSAFAARNSQILLCGQPRNDALFDKQFCADCHQKLLNIVGEEDKKIIVYMPTFRDGTDDVFSFCNTEIVKHFSDLAKKHNFIFIEKSHFVNLQKNPQNALNEEFVYTVPEMDAQTLLAGADMLITDYSSCFFDFLIRNKPIIHYVYDYDYYKNKDRGLYYTIDEVAAGSVAYDESELFYAIDENMKDEALFEERRKEILEKFATYESLKNSRVIVDEIMRRLGLS